MGDTSLKRYLEYDKISDESKDFVKTGWDYFDNKDYDNAYLYFSKAIELSPNYGHAHYMLGISIHYKGDNWEEALLHYQKAAELGNEEAQKYLRGNGYSW